MEKRVMFVFKRVFAFLGYICTVAVFIAPTFGLMRASEEQKHQGVAISVDVVAEQQELSAPFSKTSLEAMDADFKHDLMAAKIDFLLENMRKTVESPDVSACESMKFARSGVFLADHFEELSEYQKKEFMRCLAV